MKILKTERRVSLLNGGVVNADNPYYLYELTNQGSLGQRHGMILSTITNALQAKGLELAQAEHLDGLSFHNLCVSALGPYITNANSEQVYTFRSDKTMVKLDPGMKHAETLYHVKFPKKLYACVSYEADGKAVRSIEYLAILNNGVIRFVYKYTPTNFRMAVLTKELPDEVKNHLLNGVEQDGKEHGDVKSNNNPAIGFKLLLDLLDEEETNGDRTNHKG